MNYRLVNIVHMVLRCGLPKKLASTIETQTSIYGPRSETNVTLAVPRTRTRMGDRAFAVAGPRT
jgi:hypothetical protein